MEMSLQLQVCQPSQAEFKDTDKLETIVEELEYLKNRMRYYKETVTLAQVEGILSMLDNMNNDLVPPDEVERQCDEARAEGKEEGMCEAEQTGATALQKVLDNYSTILLNDSDIVEAKEYNELIKQLQSII